MHKAGKILLTAAFFTLLLRPAMAGEPVIRSSVTVKADVVTLGDLFDNAGPMSGIAVFRAPALGQSGTIQPERVAAAAASHGLHWQSTGYVPPVQVVRASREVGVDEMKKAIERHLLETRGGEAYDIILPARLESIHVEPEATGKVSVTGLMEMYGGRIRVNLSVEGSTAGQNLPVIEGFAHELIEVVEPARAIARGSIISASDVQVSRIRKDRAGVMPATTLADVVGKAARATLGADRPIRLADLEQPRLIERGKAVLMVFVRPGLTLTARGQAMQDGAEGDLVKVLNPQSNRILEGVVARDGRVIVNGQINLAQAMQAQEAR